MKTVETKVLKITILDIDGLDPVSVFLENFAAGQGQITILCYGKAWTSYWGAIGESETISSFFCGCDNDYILRKMLPETHETDFNKITDLGREKGFNLCVTNDVEVAMSANDMAACFGDEWCMDLPRCHTSDYNYLSRIIDAVKKAIG